MSEWVCSVCGSSNVDAVQPSLGDPEHPLGRCHDHRAVKSPLSPLMRLGEYQGKRRRPPDAPPEDVFGGLPDDQRAALAKPIRLL